MRLKSDSTRVRISSATKAVIILDAPYICVCITRIEYRVTNVHCIRSLQTVRPQLESQLEPQRRRHRGRHRASIRHLTLYRHEFVYQEGRAGAGKRREQGCTADLRQGPSNPDAQAQNLRPLVPKDRDASRKAAKARIRERENAEYDAMQSGDINHMPKSERLPWRIYIRDYVDARFNLGEFFIPVAFIILIGSMVVTYKWPALALPLMLIMYVYLFAVIIDVAVMWHKLKKKLIEKFGEQSVAKGMRSGSYAWSRAIQIRRWRLPKPRYPKRGHWPE